MGKNTNKPVRAPPPAGGTEPEFAEKPFHSQQYEQDYLDSLLNAPDRPTWDEFKEQQKQKGLMESQGERAEEEMSIRFRKELDEARKARLGTGNAAASASSKKHKKHKKHKKKRERDSSSSSDESSVCPCPRYPRPLLPLLKSGGVCTIGGRF